MKNFAARYSLSCICFSISVIYFHAYEVLITELKQHYNSMLPTPRTITCDKSLRASHKFFVVYFNISSIKSSHRGSSSQVAMAAQQPHSNRLASAGSCGKVTSHSGQYTAQSSERRQTTGTSHALKHKNQSKNQRASYQSLINSSVVL